MRLTCLTVLLLASLPLLPQAAAPRPDSNSNLPVLLRGSLEVVEGQRRLYLWGTPRERGFAHGYLLASDIMRSVNDDFAWLLERMPGVGTLLYSNVLLKTVVPNFVWTKEELEEIAGLLAGIEAKLPADQREVKALKRALTLEDLKAANTAGDWVALGCSTYAVRGDYVEGGAPAVARNFDFPALRALLENQIVVIVAPEEGGLPYAAVTHPGSIGVLTGMNEQGVFLSVHDVHVPASFKDAGRANTPRLMAMRRCLTKLSAKGAVPAALDVLKSWTTLYGNNIMVVTPDTSDGGPFAGVVEYDRREQVDDGATLRVLDPKDPEQRFLTCTNHHRERAGRYGHGAQNCWRYTKLFGEGTKLEAEVRLNAEQLFDVIELSAFPRGGKPQVSMENGTLHQVVAFTGKREMHIRRGVEGAHISAQTPVVLSLEKAFEHLRSLAKR